MKKQLKALLILALFFLGAGGVMLHLRVHTPAKVLYGYVPLISGILSVFLLPILFSFKKTLHLAYIINGFTAIIATITMLHFSIEKAPIIADIFLVWAKFFVGYVIFHLEIHNVEGEAFHPKGLMIIKYPNIGFWFVHLFVLTAVYVLGNLLWR